MSRLAPDANGSRMCRTLVGVSVGPCSLPFRSCPLMETLTLGRAGPVTQIAQSQMPRTRFVLLSQKPGLHRSTDHLYYRMVQSHGAICDSARLTRPSPSLARRATQLPRTNPQRHHLPQPPPSPAPSTTPQPTPPSTSDAANAPPDT